MSDSRTSSKTGDAASKLLSDLQSFLIDVQSGGSSSGSATSSAAAATTGGTDATAATSAGSTSAVTADSLASDFKDLLGTLSGESDVAGTDAAHRPSPPPGPPPSDASSTGPNGGAGNTALGQPIDRILDAIKSYTAHGTQTQTSTTTLSA